MTTQQAADILNVPRPYLIGLLEKGEIEYALVGRHRRVKAEDLLEYKNTRDSERASALDKLAKMDADLI
jgi:excisionase family DNA binding protein